MWATVPDPRGERKRRPFVIVTATEEIRPDHSVVGVAITTTFADPPPADHVSLPWDPTGRSATRLRRRSAAVCSWVVAVRPGEVGSVVGRVPADVLLQILRGVTAS